MKEQQNIKIKPTRRGRIMRILIRMFAWVGVIMLYYIGFSLLFDTKLPKLPKFTNKTNEQE